MRDFDVDMFLLERCAGTQWEKDKWFALFNHFLHRDDSTMDSEDVLEFIYDKELPLLFEHWEERERVLVEQGVQLMAKIAELENKER